MKQIDITKKPKIIKNHETKPSKPIPVTDNSSRWEIALVLAIIIVSIVFVAYLNYAALR